MFKGVCKPLLAVSYCGGAALRGLLRIDIIVDTLETKPWVGGGRRLFLEAR